MGQRVSTPPGKATSSDVPIWRTCPHCSADLGDKVVCSYRIKRESRLRYLHSIFYDAPMSVNDGGSVECEYCGELFHTCHLDSSKRNKFEIQSCPHKCMKDSEPKDLDVFTEEKIWRKWVSRSCDNSSPPTDYKTLHGLDGVWYKVDDKDLYLYVSELFVPTTGKRIIKGREVEISACFRPGLSHYKAATIRKYATE